MSQAAAAVITSLKGRQQVSLDGDSELAVSPGTSSLPTKKCNLLSINWIGRRLTWQVAPWVRSDLAPDLACREDLISQLSALDITPTGKVSAAPAAAQDWDSEPLGRPWWIREPCRWAARRLCKMHLCKMTHGRDRDGKWCKCRSACRKTRCASRDGCDPEGNTNRWMPNASKTFNKRVLAAQVSAKIYTLLNMQDERWSPRRH